MANFSASIPVEQAVAINDALAESGLGPGNFSIPCGSDTKITHAALHSWPNASFREALESLKEQFPELRITDGEGEPNLDKHIEKEPFEKVDVEAFKERKGVKQRDEVATLKAVKWRSDEDDNIWPVGTIGWARETKVRAEEKLA